MNDFRHNPRSVAALFVAVFFLVGCGRTTVTPTFPVSDNVTRPDRILVYDFAVRPDGSEVWEGPDAQTPEDIRVGNMFAKSLTDSLVAELRNRGINAYRGADAAPPGPNTASIKGRFLRASGSSVTGFALNESRMHAQVQILQGSGLRLSVVSEGQISAPNNLSSGVEKSDNAAVSTRVEADAKQMATAVADKIADYYERQGWIK